MKEQSSNYNDYKLVCLQVSENPYDERAASNVPAVHYEFPTGYHQDFGPERFKLSEGLFEHAMLGAGYIGKSVSLFVLPIFSIFHF